MDSKKPDETLVELRRISKLLAFTCCKDFNKSKSIEFLTKIGYSPKEISEFVESTPEAVRAIQSQQRNKGMKNEE